MLNKKEISYNKNTEDNSSDNIFRQYFYDAHI